MPNSALTLYLVEPLRLKNLEVPEITVSTKDPSACGGGRTCIAVNPFSLWPSQMQVKLKASRDWFRGALYISSPIELVSVVGNVLMVVPGTLAEPAWNNFPLPLKFITCTEEGTTVRSWHLMRMREVELLSMDMVRGTGEACDRDLLLS